MIRLLMIVGIHFRDFMRRFMPSNILLDLIRTRRGLKWGIPAMLLAAPYLLTASICTNLVNDGGPGWLNVFVVLSIWNALKFIVIGPVSVVLLFHARVREAVARRRRGVAVEAHPMTTNDLMV